MGDNLLSRPTILCHYRKFAQVEVGHAEPLHALFHLPVRIEDRNYCILRGKCWLHGRSVWTIATGQPPEKTGGTASEALRTRTELRQVVHFCERNGIKL